jgi:hypothetical protein
MLKGQLEIDGVISFVWAVAVGGIVIASTNSLQDGILAAALTFLVVFVIVFVIFALATASSRSNTESDGSDRI